MAHRTTRNRRRRSRRGSRRRSSRRRRSRRNPKYVVANRRRRRRRRVRPNIFGTDVMNGVVMPVAMAAVGFVGARYLGNLAAMRDWGTTDPRITKTVAAVLGAPATVYLAARVPTVARSSGALMLGMGMAAAESWMRDTPLLGGSGAAATLTEDIPPAPTNGEGSGDGTGLASYYDYPMNTEGQALSDDYYTASMLGNTGDPANQSDVEGAMDSMEAVSTVIPTDMALPARTMPQWSKVSENFVNRGDKGYAGGLFSRNLFSGMMGS